MDNTATINTQTSFSASEIPSSVQNTSQQNVSSQRSTIQNNTLPAQPIPTSNPVQLHPQQQVRVQSQIQSQSLPQPLPQDNLQTHIINSSHTQASNQQLSQSLVQGQSNSYLQINPQSLPQQNLQSMPQTQTQTQTPNQVQAQINIQSQSSAVGDKEMPEIENLDLEDYDVNKALNINLNHNNLSGKNIMQTQPSSDENTTVEIEALSKMISQTYMPAELVDRCTKYIDRLKRMNRRGTYTGEFETIEKYIGWVTSIPWKKISSDNLEITNAKKLMDETHYGMNTVKNMILDYLAVMQLKAKSDTVDQAAVPSIEQNNIADQQNNNMAILRGASANAPVMLFVGLQGVGKTSIAKSIANAMGREFVRISVGAMGDVRMLRGSFRGNADAEPGQIIKALIKCKTMNPIILLDEIDKASGNTALLSDIMAALLEILDPEQNATFVDHYIDYPIDLSKVFFICTANNLGTLSAALLDRMEVIRFSSYTDEEKRVIAEKYAFPKVLRNTGLPTDAIQIRDDVWSLLIRPVGFDAGIRQLERNLATLARSAARKILDGTPTPIVITPENVKQFVLPDQGPLS